MTTDQQNMLNQLLAPIFGAVLERRTSEDEQLFLRLLYQGNNYLTSKQAAEKLADVFKRVFIEVVAWHE